MTNARPTKLKTGDNIVVTAGKDKGKTGKITKVMPSEGRMVVEGVNLAKRHYKASMTREPGIANKEMPIHVSNVMLADPKDGKPTRVGYREENGKKVRFAKRSGQVLAN